MHIRDDNWRKLRVKQPVLLLPARKGSCEEIVK